MSDGRVSQLQVLVQIATCFLLAAMSALISHALIDVITGAFDGEREVYESYRHIAVGPLLLGAAAVAALLLGRCVVSSLAQRRLCDPLALASRLTTEIPAPHLWLITFLFATLLLFGIESCEQLSAFGHVEGFAEALGGHIACGLSILCLVALGVAGSASRVAVSLSRAITMGCATVAVLFLKRCNTHVAALLARLGAVDAPILLHEGPLLSRGKGMRGPPARR